VLGQCARRNGIELGVGELLERQIAPVVDLRRLSVQAIRDFADGCQFAFLSPFN
jgi:hypothetical protein